MTLVKPAIIEPPPIRQRGEPRSERDARIRYQAKAAELLRMLKDSDREKAQLKHENERLKHELAVARGGA